MTGAFDPCEWCEQVLQPYLDRELTDAEVQQAELHLEGCSYCRKRYHFEARLRRYVRQAVPEMEPEMKLRLAKLRFEL
jgi:anti-sigma factor (TIGR02949 family)